MENTPDPKKTILLGSVGAVLGAVLGWAIFYGLTRVGLYALVAPGAMAGIVAGRCTRQYSVPVGIISLFVGAVATVLSEWHHAPWIADDSLVYFVTHLHKLSLPTMILGGLGIAVAFLSGRGQH